MNQREIEKLMNEIDRKCKLPKYWNKFIKEIFKPQSIIIKDKKQNNLFCTNCNTYFENKEFKVRECAECPTCNKKSVVYGSNFYIKSFRKSVALVQRMNKQIIIRIFEVYTYFDAEMKIAEQSYIEYARILPGIGRFLGSNTYINMYGTLTVYHECDKIYWFEYKGRKYFTDCLAYPYNKKRLLKGTNMEYAPIEEFLEKYSCWGYNFLDVLEFAAYESFELLWNMKLYNLCFHSKALNKNGSFYKRFGVPKNFLKFMQENNVTYKDLMILQTFQKQDKELLEKYQYDNINYIKFLLKHNILEEYFNLYLKLDKDRIKLLNQISKFVPLKKLMKYTEGLENLSIYRDYLYMAKELSLNYKSQKDLFPNNLISRHDELQAKIEVIKNVNTEISAYLRYLELSKYTYSDEKYIIFPAPSVDSMIDEGEQQDNCVAKMYLNEYIEGKTEIFFARRLDDICKSFITLEYNNGHVVQKELSNHRRNFTEEQNEFINKWLEFRQFINSMEKVKVKKEHKTIKYDLRKMVA